MSPNLSPARSPPGPAGHAVKYCYLTFERRTATSVEKREWVNAGVNSCSAWNMVLDTADKNLDSQRPWPQNALLTVDTTTKTLNVTPAQHSCQWVGNRQRTLRALPRTDSCRVTRSARRTFA
jgi:hypothetical protein